MHYNKDVTYKRCNDMVRVYTLLPLLSGLVARAEGGREADGCDDDVITTSSSG